MKGKLSDYWVLCKPRVVMLMVFTATVGMYLALPATTELTLSTWLPAMSGIALLASSAAAINHIVERNSDLLMVRTMQRPVAAGRISLTAAWLFAAIVASAGIALLYYWVNIVTTLLTVITALGYAFAYTLYLKPRTSQNIVIGGIFGAMPPLLGWTAISDQIVWAPLLLVLLIFVWTPVHFWAFALYRYQDYLGGQMPMLPVTHGVVYTKICICCYSLLTVLVSILIFALGISNCWYLLCASLMDLVLLILVGQLCLREPVKRWALINFFYSMVYLFGLFLAMAADRYWQLRAIS